MQRVVLDMQSYITGDAIQMALRSNGDFQVVTVTSPDDTEKKCFNFAATVVIMEVTGYTPWKLEERLRIRDKLKKSCPNCKIALLVDENTEKQVAEEIKQAKANGLIDLFLYGSTSASFLAALIDVL